MLESALQLAALGYRIHPVQTNKRPILQGWPDIATTDPETVTAWWSGRYANCLIGIATGPGSGCYVIDFDGRDGERSYEWMVERLGELPATVKARTPRGFHIYGRIVPGVDIRNTTRLGDMEGVDVRGAGGYVVAAPGEATHGSYAWIVSPMDMAPAELPDNWLEVVASPRVNIAHLSHATA